MAGTRRMPSAESNQSRKCLPCVVSWGGGDGRKMPRVCKSLAIQRRSQAIHTMPATSRDERPRSLRLQTKLKIGIRILLRIPRRAGRWTIGLSMVGFGEGHAFVKLARYCSAALPMNPARSTDQDGRIADPRVTRRESNRGGLTETRLTWLSLDC